MFSNYKKWIQQTFLLDKADTTNDKSRHYRVCTLKNWIIQTFPVIKRKHYEFYGLKKWTLESFLMEIWDTTKFLMTKLNITKFSNEKSGHYKLL